jgi:hypothetical protein
MLAYFPKANEDELITSVIARAIDNYGLDDDRNALRLLFGNHYVVPNSFMQGHIRELLNQVHPLWGISPEKLISKHTILPVFRPFISELHYRKILDNLITGSTNSSANRSGINASLLNWRSNYYICPVCWDEQQTSFGYAYWNRLFQLPGVNCCIKHHCELVDTGISHTPAKKHHFVSTKEYTKPMAEVKKVTSRDFILVNSVNQLLTLELPSVEDWTGYYKNLALQHGFMNGKKIDHQAVAKLMLRYWSNSWLTEQGLAVTEDRSWLLDMFRKHRKSFSFLQHLIVWQAFENDKLDIMSICQKARSLSIPNDHSHKYKQCEDPITLKKYRQEWLSLMVLHSDYSLKELRQLKDGKRLYSWLYRFDNSFLQENKPEAQKIYINNRVNWKQRDIALVRQFIKIEKNILFDITGVRRSRAWFSNQINCKSLIERKLEKLPLCKLFFTKYAETVEEFQIRRLAIVCSELIENFDFEKERWEIERLTGLSKERITAFAECVLQKDVPNWLKCT